MQKLSDLFITQNNLTINLQNLNEMKNDYLNFVLTYKSYDTYQCYNGHLNIVLDYLINKFNVNYDIDVKNEFIYDYIKFERQKDLSFATINKRINVLKRMFKYNKSSINLDDILTLKENYTTYNCLDYEDIIKLISYVKNSTMCLQNKLMIMLFLESGVRRKELRFIEISNIDFSNKCITLTITKSKKPRLVFYKDLTEKYLYDHLKSVKNRKYLFNVSNHSISSCFARIQKQLMFKNFSPYVLRHSYATIIVNNDGNMEMLRQTMGHEKLTTTQRYIYYNKKYLAESYSKFFKIEK